MQGLLESSSEREFVILVLGAIISGVFTFALGWKGLLVMRDIVIHMIEWHDTTRVRE
jgi:hypothetical protein